MNPRYLTPFFYGASTFGGFANAYHHNNVITAVIFAALFIGGMIIFGTRNDN